MKQEQPLAIDDIRLYEPFRFRNKYRRWEGRSLHHFMHRSFRL